ncbi:hypothetical protein BDY19DRAFT_1053966 [Irpex rosettiformis]|uniref:Uncharacterized protein n=1 Tax=Irpex rosettiformis TaxID=378272 RepID=A0ACB8UEK5_9APHY|nr:hypothetical protein BDY19DRAFT_1053966 [Irpex rosettiformis]
MRQPTLFTFFPEHSGSSHKRRREKDNGFEGGGKVGKAKIKVDTTIVHPTRSRQHSNGNDEPPTITKKFVALIKAGPTNTPRVAVSSSSSEPTCYEMTGLASPESTRATPSSNREKTGYLPTPITTKSKKLTRPSTTMVSALTSNDFQHTRHHQLSTPTTPTRQQSAPAKSFHGSLYFPITPQSSFISMADTVDTSPNASERNGETMSQTIIPSSQTQILEINPFALSGTTSHQPEHSNHIILPSRFTNHASLSHFMTNDENDEEFCIVPSSQTQELNHERPPSPPSQLSTHRVPSGPSSSSEIIPDSQPPTTGVFSSPTRQKKQAVSPTSKRSFWYTGTIDAKGNTDPSQGTIEREVIPTSQCIHEKEMTSLEFLDISARLKRSDGSSNSHKRPDVTVAEDAISDIQKRSSTGFLLSSEACRTPTRRRRNFGRDTNLEGSPSVIPILRSGGSSRSPKTPCTHVRFSKDDPQAVPQSSQTEPESSQWHVPTQYSPSKRPLESSQTELESSQWRIPTQSSQTEEEPSQWRVPTQYTPRGRHKLGAPQFDNNDGDDSQPLFDSLSLPVASYHDESEGEAQPSSSSTRCKYSGPPKAHTDEEMEEIYGQDDDRIPGASSFSLSQLDSPQAILQRLAHARLKLIREPVDSQLGVSGSSFSIPSDYDGA